MLEITGEEKPFRKTAKGPERGRELNPINHDRLSRFVQEFVAMPEMAEWATYLFIDEPCWNYHLSNPACHPHGKSEMPSPPRHFFPQGYESRLHSCDRHFPGSGHGLHVSIDAARSVEQLSSTHTGPSNALEESRHVTTTCHC